MKKVFRPHIGPLWTASLGNRVIKFKPIQLIGGRTWSLALIRIKEESK